MNAAEFAAGSFGRRPGESFVAVAFGSAQMEITMQRHTPHSRGHRSGKERHRIGTAAESHAHKSIGGKLQTAVESGRRGL